MRIGSLDCALAGCGANAPIANANADKANHILLVIAFS
jgi:hypothetical protein